MQVCVSKFVNESRHYCDSVVAHYELAELNSVNRLASDCLRSLCVGARLGPLVRVV